MKRNSARCLIGALALCFSSLTLGHAADTKAPAVSWKADLLAWRAQQAKDLQEPNGWLTLIGLEWLKSGDNAFGSAKGNALVVPAQAAPNFGIVRLTGDTLQLLPPSGGYPKGLQVDGAAPTNPQNLAPDSSGRPSKITLGTITITAIHRGDRYGLRIKDSKAATLLHFHGLKWYPPNEAYRVQAKWIPYNPPHHVPVPTILGTEVMSDVPGAAEFTLDGKTYRLEPIVESPDDKDLFFILRDATSKTETYGAGRFLYTDFPDHGLTQAGELWLDFNRAENPPCAYTPYATCPLPPPQNRLPVPIPAGQQRYHE
ncbi:MAG TPA: DUF1684 domain-containing protein [Terriglobales bacterium]